MAKETITKAKEPEPQVTPENESVYEAAEIAANAPKLFGYSVDIAAAALDFNKVERCTLATAKQTIKEFAERKVI